MSKTYSIERGACDLNSGWELRGRSNRRWKDYIKIDLKEMMQLVYDHIECHCTASSSATSEVGRMAEMWVVASCLIGRVCPICIEYCRWKIRCPLEWILCDMYRVWRMFCWWFVKHFFLFWQCTHTAAVCTELFRSTVQTVFKYAALSGSWSVLSLIRTTSVDIRPCSHRA